MKVTNEVSSPIIPLRFSLPTILSLLLVLSPIAKSAARGEIDFSKRQGRRFWMRVVRILLLAACAFGCAEAKQAIKVPHGDGSPVLIDGKFSVEEWHDASVITTAGRVTIYFKQLKGYVFIGIKTPAASASYVDMFLLIGDNQLYNLHASMQIGERLLSGREWNDTSPLPHWGNNIDWIANEAKIDAEKDRSFPISKRLFPYEGLEFQLRRARFAGKQWQMRIEVRDFEGQSPDVVFPSNSERKSTANWAVLDLGRA